MNKESPDEKLLKLIEGAGRPGASAQFGIKQKPKVSLVLPAWANLKFFKSVKFTLPNINLWLAGFAGLVTLYFFYSLIAGGLKSNNFTLPAAKGGLAGLKLNWQEDGRFLQLEEYLKDIVARNVFLSSEMKAAVTKEAEKEKGIDISELVKGLRLAGVIWSSNPEVMIENTGENRTYLIKQGEAFGQQQFKVKKITHNSAILSIPTVEGEKEYELR